MTDTTDRAAYCTPSILRARFDNLPEDLRAELPELRRLATAAGAAILSLLDGWRRLDEAIHHEAARHEVPNPAEVIGGLRRVAGLGNIDELGHVVIDAYNQRPYALESLARLAAGGPVSARADCRDVCWHTELSEADHDLLANCQNSGRLGEAMAWLLAEDPVVLPIDFRAFVECHEWPDRSAMEAFCDVLEHQDKEHRQRKQMKVNLRMIKAMLDGMEQDIVSSGRSSVPMT